MFMTREQKETFGTKGKEVRGGLRKMGLIVLFVK
jgi:hypothetical protein